jgi:hypothetical protein
MLITIQKLSCKASCKTLFFFIVHVFALHMWYSLSKYNHAHNINWCKYYNSNNTETEGNNGNETLFLHMSFAISMSTLTNIRMV